MTAKRKLIRRNAHKMIAKIFEDSTTAKVYTLNNGFVGESIGVEWVKEHTANISHAEHYDNLNGTYTIRIHSNLWYDLASENKGPDSEPDVIHDNKHLLGPIYRRKSDCALCGFPVWGHIYENGDYYLSCACGETSIRKKADFNRENFVFAEQGEI